MARVVRWAPWVLLAGLAAWLASAGLLVELEYFDGYDSILNARFFAGQHDVYTSTRGPLVGALLLPAASLHGGLDLHPLDTRPYHGTTALLNIGYLVGLYVLMRRTLGGGAPVTLAFAAAVPTFVFFSYAPFVSHDIIPGLLLVAMLVLAARFHDSPSARLWAAMTALGAAALMVKPVFGLFWACVLVGELAAPPSRGASPARRLGPLFAGALASTACALLVSAAVTATAFPETPFWARGLRHMAFLAVVTHQKATVEPIWVYFRNAPAYGPLAVMLVIPGIVLSWRGTDLARRMAVAWIVLVVAFHLVGVRQVRYLAVLGGVTAFTIVPPLERLMRSSFGAAAALCVFAAGFVPVHSYAAATEMARIATPFYRRAPVRDFLAHLERSDGALPTPIYVNWFALSFVPERNSPFAGDLYHDVFHFGTHHLSGLYGLPASALVQFYPERGETPQRWPDGSAMIACSTGHIVNRTTWSRGTAERKFELEQSIHLATAVVLERSADGGWRLEPGGPVLARPTVVQGRSGLVISGPPIVAMRDDAPYAKAEVPGGSEPVDVLFSPSGEAFVPAAETGPVRIRLFARVIAQRNAGPAAASAPSPVTSRRS